MWSRRLVGWFSHLTNNGFTQHKPRDSHVPWLNTGFGRKEGRCSANVGSGSAGATTRSDPLPLILLFSGRALSFIRDRSFLWSHCWCVVNLPLLLSFPYLRSFAHSSVCSLPPSIIPCLGWFPRSSLRPLSYETFPPLLPLFTSQQVCEINFALARFKHTHWRAYPLKTKEPGTLKIRVRQGHHSHITTTGLGGRSCGRLPPIPSRPIIVAFVVCCNW